MIFHCGEWAPIRTVARLILLVLPAALTHVRAEEPQFWSELEWKIAETERWEWVWGGGVRLKDYATNSFDRRVGTAFDFTVGRMFTLSGGYLFRNRDISESETDFDHRLIGGLNYELLDGKRWRIEGTTLYERHIDREGSPAFNRYRQQFELEQRRKRLSPFAHEDLTFRREGFVRSRSRAGLRWRFDPGYSLDVAYQFESLKSGAAWRPRHVLYTELRFDGPEISRNRR